MTKLSSALATCAILLAAPIALAADAPPPMSFFITSVGIGKGADLGGLAGADAHCAKLASAAGSKYTQWKAYLSTQGASAVNARDRIGQGPWHGAKGNKIASNLAELHGDTVELARIGNAVMKNTALSEKGDPINGVGNTPNMHDILTGTKPDGTAYTDAADHTCKNWTSTAADGIAQVGHFDRAGGGISWNAVHPSRGCSQENLVATGGAGLFYCFAADAK